MSLSEVIMIGIALSMDAFGITLSIGLSSMLTKRNKIKFILSFSVFQFLFAYIGGGLGYLFDTYIISISSVCGGIIIGIVGVLMIFDGIKNEESDVLIKNSTCIILGISVSIDALVIGFTVFHHLGSNLILMVNSLLIGLITLFICTLGFFICRYIKKLKFVTKYANFLGGLALILFACKMIFF
ncbi:manganese efflux pump MntP family protein [Clostridium uliginosum]|uniref:Putative Mn2+ efflux pump MntP n=1 Tax=Clostridium uliginosum TaxID=119641 RepID=A0A1I1RNX5_9CLOT|nr:manganese efflux pump [Clostridium uliginosum]SFD33233.1 Putative Mn2+ efflux pump MntP [Clostridium uliginosum]